MFFWRNRRHTLTYLGFFVFSAILCSCCEPNLGHFMDSIKWSSTTGNHWGSVVQDSSCLPIQRKRKKKTMTDQAEPCRWSICPHVALYPLTTCSDSVWRSLWAGTLSPPPPPSPHLLLFDKLMLIWKWTLNSAQPPSGCIAYQLCWT